MQAMIPSGYNRVCYRLRVRQLALLVVVGLLCCSTAFSKLPEEGISGWTVARSSHFEVYSQTGPERARIVLTHFEELSSFFDRNRIVPVQSRLEKKPPVRVIEFSSKREYDTVKLRATADAYYTGTADRDYIVMPQLGSDDFRVAAHEYAHFVLHSDGLQLPAWLDEGLAEIFSTVRITNRRCELDGELPVHVETLRRHPWFSASQLFTAQPDSPLLQIRSGAAIFYAESWALADMLTSSPEYAPHFGDLIALLNSATVRSQQALARIYSKSPEKIVADAQNWIGHGRSSRRTLLPAPPEIFDIEVNQISESQARALIADLLFANGNWDRSEQIYQELLRQSPGDPELLASLGTIALRKGNRHAALVYWGKALHRGLNNAALCYRYALLADEMELPSGEIQRALEQAIVIQPDFDDARYKLALLNSNAGDYGAAVNQLESMTKPPASRAFAYWTALAYALSELGKRDESESAANQAMRFASSSEEHAQAARLAYVAKTDLTVRFERGADGNLQLTTARIPHGTTDFNPFIEANDRIEVATGTLREVQCDGGRLTAFLVESKSGTLTLSVPDPTHVLMRNAPSEFNCGPQTAKNVKAEYAKTAKPGTGLLRGMEFQ